MSLVPGVRMAHFEIGPSLGAGGMGEVYQARDTTLGRDVALKVLPAAFARDPERLARLEREARTLASLNHPNIAAIYNLEQAGDQRVLVMELVPGPTLAERLGPVGRVLSDPPSATAGSKGPGLHLEEALAVARQIAEALEAAHAKGIIHRDLKPANIKVTPEGKVKLLDFGLAKAFADEPDPANLSLSPTMAGATAAGIILGTAAYMSPEQARGKKVDAQTDIWAFGCVLYEMLTTRKAFEGDTVTDVLAAVVRAEPDWNALPPETPDKLRALIKRCLQKDPTRRLHHVGDARLEIEDAVLEPATVRASDASPADRLRQGDGGQEGGRHVRVRPAWMRAIPWTLTAASIAVAVLAVGVASRRDTSSNPLVTRLEINLPPGVDLYTAGGTGVAISPDGTFLAFVGNATFGRQAYLRRIDRSEIDAVRGTNLAQSVFFAPDGASLGVLASDGTVKSVSTKDGLVRTVARGVDNATNAAWTPDNHIVFVRDRMLWEIPASGGTAKQLTTLDRERHEVLHNWPAVLPGGGAVLFASYSSATADAARIEGLTLTDGKRRSILDQSTHPMYSRTGHLIFVRDGALLATPFDVARLESTGAPVRIVDSVAVSGAGAALAAISDSGSFVYAQGGQATARLVWVSRQGAETSITNAIREYVNPRVSPDGRRIVVQNGSTDLWLQDTTRPMLTRLTAAETNTSWPAWTPDGQRVLYRSATGIHAVQTDGSNRQESIAGTSQQDLPSSVSPDGETLAFLRISPDTGGDIYLLSLHGDPKPRPLIKTASYEGGPQFSPDGRWLAFASDESGQMQVYVRPLPGPDRKTQVSTEGGSYPRWGPSGKELFYRNGDKMMVVDVTIGADLTMSVPRMLFEQRFAFIGNTIANYDISRDGQRFVAVKGESSANRLNVVLNWFEELKRRVPTSR